ncbi:hypothetical protein IWZ00DRAFT_561472 [Phyllosticta capitalensis]
MGRVGRARVGRGWMGRVGRARRRIWRRFLLRFRLFVPPPHLGSWCCWRRRRLRRRRRRRRHRRPCRPRRLCLRRRWTTRSHRAAAAPGKSPRERQLRTTWRPLLWWWWWWRRRWRRRRGTLMAVVPWWFCGWFCSWLVGWLVDAVQMLWVGTRSCRIYRIAVSSAVFSTALATTGEQPPFSYTTSLTCWGAPHRTAPQPQNRRIAFMPSPNNRSIHGPHLTLPCCSSCSFRHTYWPESLFCSRVPSFNQPQH